ncbi:hypothetical protein M3Y94_00299400 [Aphelenchoides besseyi]|nr:hypothetical protein M3Y94_00299400 [Aphelenchoides besseyi]KAI6235847.1 hypothetical protein M3Y95_00094900 [Aphelenchoides besseyi]
MLSLLSLLLASGTVLRPDTEQWTALTYPDPRTNFSQCNTWLNSTLCDPDHILTDQWRQEINMNLNKLMDKLRTFQMEYAEEAPTECYDNSTESIQFYIILAKRIQTDDNQTTSEADMTRFGDGLVDKLGLRSSPCKNFLIFVGVEAAKMAYVRTGSDLKLPPDLMKQIFDQYKLFKAKNFMDVLNKIVNEIGEKIVDPSQSITSTPESNLTETDKLIQQIGNETMGVDIYNNISTTQQLNRNLIYGSVQSSTWWIFGVVFVLTFVAISALFVFAVRAHAKAKRDDISQSTSCRPNCSDSVLVRSSSTVFKDSFHDLYTVLDNLPTSSSAEQNNVFTMRDSNHSELGDSENVETI